MKTLIKNALVHDSINRTPYEAYILIEDGKIALIENMIECEDAEVVDAKGLRAYAGFIDAHSHIGLAGYGVIGFLQPGDYLGFKQAFVTIQHLGAGSGGQILGQDQIVQYQTLFAGMAFVNHQFHFATSQSTTRGTCQ